MQRFETLTSPAIAFGADNVDTDVIIPARYLKALTREGLGEGAFAALRAEPGNIFDEGRAAGARILLAGANFGCGSSREHAPWALLDFGIRAVIAESFADIFAGNAFKNGLLAAALPREAVARLMAVAAEGLPITVDLEAETVATPAGDRFGFAIDPFARRCLLEGLDEIALTETEDAAIAAHEARVAAARPWVAGAAGAA
jgi:3-isopropylmalate/(R)-2-methylmalate dehydratase small subunit